MNAAVFFATRIAVVATLLVTVSCARYETAAPLPLEDGDQTVVVVRKFEGMTTVTVFDREELPLLRWPLGDTWLLTYPHSAEDLQIPRGVVTSSVGRPRVWPPSRRVFRAVEGGLFAAAAPDLSEYSLPAFDEALCAARGGCRSLGPNGEVCGRECRVEIELPAPPRMPSYSSWKAVPGQMPEPPLVPAEPCPRGLRFDVHEELCVAIDTCPDGLFRDPPDGEAVYVLEGGSGDGTLEAPLGSIREALSRRPGLPVMLGPGKYWLPTGTRRGELVHLVGRCVADTRVESGISAYSDGATVLEHLELAPAGSFGSAQLSFNAPITLRNVDVQEVRLSVFDARAEVSYSSIRSSVEPALRLSDSGVLLAESQFAGGVGVSSSRVDVTVSASYLWADELSGLSVKRPAVVGRVSLSQVRAWRSIDIWADSPFEVLGEDVAVLQGGLNVENVDLRLRGVYAAWVHSFGYEGYLRPNYSQVEDIVVGSLSLWRMREISIVSVVTSSVADVSGTFVQLRDVTSGGDLRVATSAASGLDRIRVQGDFSVNCVDGELSARDVAAVGLAYVRSSGGALSLARVSSEEGLLLKGSAAAEGSTSVSHARVSRGIDAAGPAISVEAGPITLDHFEAEGGVVGIEARGPVTGALRNGRLVGQPEAVSDSRGFELLPLLDGVVLDRVGAVRGEE